jgi:hypothetical protein
MHYEWFFHGGEMMDEASGSRLTLGIPVREVEVKGELGSRLPPKVLGLDGVFDFVFFTS